MAASVAELDEAILSFVDELIEEFVEIGVLRKPKGIIYRNLHRSASPTVGHRLEKRGRKVKRFLAAKLFDFGAGFAFGYGFGWFGGITAHLIIPFLNTIFPSLWKGLQRIFEVIDETGRDAAAAVRKNYYRNATP